MKKKEIMKLTACGLLTVVLTTSPAFAAGTAGTDNSVPAATVNAAQPADGTADRAEESAGLNILTTGKVSEVTDNKDYYTIRIENDNMGMVLNANPDVFVIDQANPGQMLALSDIKKDMTITAVIRKDAPMTMSIPPMTSGVTGLVLNSDKGSTDLSVYDDELVNEANTLKLNINESGSDATRIISANGARMASDPVAGGKIAYRAEDLRGCELLVLYTVSTRSIPAQTTPQMVVVLTASEDLSPAPTPEEDGAVNGSTPEAQSYVPLRENAESKGYTVTWTGNDKPIVLTKGDLSVTITIGQTSYTSTAATDSNDTAGKLTMEKAPKLENGSTLVTRAFMDSLI